MDRPPNLPPKPPPIRSLIEREKQELQNQVYHTSQQQEQSGQPRQDSNPGTVRAPPFQPAVLLDKSQADLQQLLDDPTLLDALFIAEHPLYAKHERLLGDVYAEIQAELDQIKVVEPEAQKTRLMAEASVKTTKALEKQWEEIEVQMYNSLKPYSGAAIFANLQAAMHEAERMSESIEQSFLEGEGDGIQDFIREHRAARKLFHLRRERAERFKDGRVSGFR